MYYPFFFDTGVAIMFVITLSQTFWIDFILFCVSHKRPRFSGQLHYPYSEQPSNISLLKIISHKLTTAI